MRPKTTPEQKAEIIYRFFNDKDKRMQTIADLVDVNVIIVNKVITEYLKNPSKKEDQYITLNSKLNSMKDETD